ncbi:xanthotoxin 5-hydroxylase CYP82C4-like [Euphorbia lathyris]|uniref:xanthotoxin 5-hydroxylase CYP82C4-like n=1 Tax=Euphorbia lathyris TaxID=212925 RepID=UPI00331377CC
MEELNHNLQLLLLSGLISITFLYISLLRKKRTSIKNQNEAPEPSGAWPIIGHLHLLAGSDKLLHQTLGNMADKHGPAFNIRLGNRRVFVVSSSEIAEECFTSKDKALASRPRTTATKHMCYNDAMFGFSPFSPHWREMRKISTQMLLSSRRFEIIKTVHASEVDIGIRKLHNLWTQNGFLPVIVDVKEWSAALTLNVIVRMVAGKCFSDGSDEEEAVLCRETIAEFFRLLGIFVVSDAIPFLWWLDLKGHVKEMKKTGKDLDGILEGWVNEHRRKRGVSEVKAEKDLDFIDAMLTIEEAGRLEGFPFDGNTSIKATCLTVIAGGSDTTGNMLTWAISLLMNNKFALKKAQEELDLHVGPARKIQVSDLKNLVYLQAIVKETLRLYPVAPLSGPRESLEDCTVAGYHVPAGARLIMNLWKIQRDPKLWENPTVFEPERFLRKHVDVDVSGNQFELIPFGGGRRSCLGSSFAFFSIHFTLSVMVHAFDLVTPMGMPVDMREKPGLAVPRATPLELLLSPRPPATLYCTT